MEKTTELKEDPFFTRNTILLRSWRSGVYLIKIAALFVISALQKNEIKYKISTDDISAGKFDDLVFKFTYKEDAVSWFLQVRHREIDTKITLRDLFSQTGTFSLRTYFHSFLYIRKQPEHSENVESRYIIFTPAVLDFNSNQVEEESLTISSGNTYLRFKRVMEEHDLLDIRKYMFQIQPDDFIKRHLRNTPGATDDNIEDFLKNLRFAVRQPTERQLEYILLEKAGKANTGIQPETLRERICQNLHIWARQVTPETNYFTQTEVAEIYLQILSDAFKETIMLDGIELCRYSTINESVFYMIPSSLRLCCNRLIGYPMGFEERFVLRLGDLVKVQGIIIPYLPFKKATIIIIVCEQTDVTVEAKKVIEYLIAKMQYKSTASSTSTMVTDISKLIFVLSDETMKHLIESHDLRFFEDDTSFESLSSVTQALLMKKVVIFQGVPTPLNNLCNSVVKAGLNSHHTELLVSETNIVVGKSVLKTEDIIHFFVPRKIYEQSTLQEKCLVHEIDILGKLDKKLIVVIAAEPGMGKTSLLYRVAEEWKRKNTDQWVINASLNDVGIKLKEKNINENIPNFMELLIDIFLEGETSLSKYFFRHSLETGKFLLLLDGYDEVESKVERENVCVFLNRLKENSRGQVIITTRLNFKEELEEATSSVAYRLEPLTVKEQENLLGKTWIKNLGFSSDENSERVNVYASEVVKIYIQDVGEQGIPLQIMLLAEVYEEDCKLYCNDTTHELRTNHIKNIFVLYRRFEIKRCENFVSENIPSDNKSFRESLKETILEEHRNICRKVAIEKMLRRSEDLCNCCLLKESKKFLLTTDDYIFRIGILQKCEGNKMSFIHTTFAEYFLALHLFTEGISCPECLNVIKEEFYQSSYSLIRMFVDNMLARNNRFLEAVTLNDIVVLEEELKNGTAIDKRDALGRTPCHLAAALANVEALQFLLESGCDIMATDKLGFTSLDISLKQRNKKMCRHFLTLRVKLQLTREQVSQLEKCIEEENECT